MASPKNPPNPRKHNHGHQHPNHLGHRRDTHPHSLSHSHTHSYARLMPWVCLGLAAMVAWNLASQWQPKSRGHPSVSIREQEFIWDYCANMSLLPYSPANSHFGRLEPFGVQGFVFVSAYRLNVLSFAVLGLTSSSIKSTWGTFQEACLWLSFSGPELIPGKLEFRFLSSRHQSFTYDVVIIQCTLTEPTPRTAGGSLLLNILGLDELAVYREDPGPRELNPIPPFKHRLAMCSTVLLPKELGQLSASRTVEQLLFSQFFGASFFVLYDGGGAGPELERAVGPFTRARVLDLVDLRGLQRLSVDADAVAINDCALRTRFKAEWTIVLSYDEYPTMQMEPKLSHLLKVNAGRPWLSIGTQVWDTSMCMKMGVEDLMLVEKMIFRRHKPFCANTTADPLMCLGNDGIRRLLFDPRKVLLLSPHAAVFPKGQGLDLNTTVMRINKFVGLASPASLTCEFPVSETHFSERWERDTTISRLVNQGKLSGQMALPDA